MKEIGDFFKQNLENQMENPPPQIWEKLKSDDQILNYNKKQKLQRLTLYTLPTAIILTIALISIILLKNGSPLNNEQLISPVENEKELVLEDSQEVEVVEDISENMPIADVKEITIMMSKDENLEMEVQSPVIQKNIKPSAPLSPAPKNIESPQVDIKESDKLQDVEPLTPSDNANSIQEVLPIEKKQIEKEDSIKPRYYDYTGESTHESDGNLHAYQEDEIPDLAIPDAFSPNGDGINDEFLPKALQEISDYSILIYDRSGKQLFHARDVNIGWNGEYKGQLLPTNSYVYIITYRNSQGEMKVEKGMFVLVR